MTKITKMTIIADMRYKIPISYIDLLLATLFIATSGLAFAFGYKGLGVLLQIMIIFVTIIIIYLAAAYIYKVIVFYDEKMVFNRPLLGQSMVLEYDKIKSITIKHVYNAGAQMFIYYEIHQGKLCRIQFDYRRKIDVPLLQFLEKKGMEILKDA